MKSFTASIHYDLTDIHNVWKINNYVINVEIIILDSKCAQLLVQNAADVDARIICKGLSYKITTTSWYTHADEEMFIGAL